MFTTAAGVTTLTAAELAGRIKSGELSARAVVDAHIRRIEQVNRRLNAIVFPLFEQARAEADAADRAQRRGDPLGPLHGIPLTIKDQFFVAGTPTTFGLESRAGHRADRDGPIVNRLRQAGAIILGKGNVPQMLMYQEADNFLYGRTNNPWNLDRTPGGGTGGDAATVASGGAPLALAADFTGSIRIPGHFCGIHGLKPTAGRLTLRDSPAELFFPGNESISMQLGPFARSVADLDLALRVMAAPGLDAIDPLVAPAAWPDYAAVSLNGLRVAMYEDDGFLPASPAVRRAVRESADALRQRGAHVEPFRPPAVPDAIGLVFGLLGGDSGAWLRRALGRNKRDPRVRMLLQAGLLPNAARPLVAGLLELGGQRRLAGTVRMLKTLPAGGYFALMAERDGYRDRFKDALDRGRYDAIICPPYPLPALRHGDTFYLFTAISYCVLYNLLGMPAGVVAATRVRPGEESDRPTSRDIVERTARAVERDSAGLPVGVQVVARHWREDVALAVMAGLEAHFRAQPDYPATPPLSED